MAKIEIKKSLFTDDITIGEYINKLNINPSKKHDWNNYASQYINRYFKLNDEWIKFIDIIDNGMLAIIIKYNKNKKIAKITCKEINYFSKYIVNNAIEITEQDFHDIYTKTLDVINKMNELEKNQYGEEIKIPEFLLRSEGFIYNFDIEETKDLTLKKYKSFVRKINNKTKKEANLFIQDLKEKLLNKIISCKCQNYDGCIIGLVKDIKLEKNEYNLYILIDIQSIDILTQGIESDNLNDEILINIYNVYEENINDIFY